MDHYAQTKDMTGRQMEAYLAENLMIGEVVIGLGGRPVTILAKYMSGKVTYFWGLHAGDEEPQTLTAHSMDVLA